MKCLIVEDDPISCRIMEKLLSKHGGNSTTADNGQIAVEKFSQALENKTPYKLVMMDIMMPEVDGLVAVQKIREMERSLGIKEEQQVKIIMTTALSDPRTVMKALYEVQANSYLFKPIDPQKLVVELHALKLIA